MQLYVIARGVHQHLNQWKSDLNAQWCKVYEKGKPKKDKNGNQLYQRLSITPIELVEIRFPKEELQNVVDMVGFTPYVEEQHKHLKMISKLLRKVLRLKAPPKTKNHLPLMVSNPIDKAVSIVPLGIKEDLIHEGNEQL